MSWQALRCEGISHMLIAANSLAPKCCRVRVLTPLTPAARAKIRPPRPVADWLADVLVAFEPVVQCPGDDIGGMHQVAGHQRIHRGQRGLDRRPLPELVRSAIGEHVLELDLDRKSTRLNPSPGY